MAALGVGDRDTVVAYDDDGGAIAARLAWMLRVTGHDAAVLDGGIAAWPGPLETTAVARGPVAFTPSAWPAERVAGIDEVAATGDVVIDSRSAERYAGAPDDLDPRHGHIPGARSLPTREHLGADGRLQDRDALRARFAAVGVGPGAAVVSYCGSGVTACHNLLVLEQAGLGPGRLFAGSWSQWSRDPPDRWRPVPSGWTGRRPARPRRPHVRRHRGQQRHRPDRRARAGRAGARVVLAVRDTARGEAAAATSTGAVEVRALDLADLGLGARVRRRPGRATSTCSSTTPASWRSRRRRTRRRLRAADRHQPPRALRADQPAAAARSPTGSSPCPRARTASGASTSTTSTGSAAATSAGAPTASRSSPTCCSRSSCSGG